MTTEEIVIIPTGVANVASLIAAFKRLGASARVSNDPLDIENAARVALPGVGAFGPAMSKLKKLKLCDPIRERISAGKPTLAICLGMQLLAEGSEETKNIRGLGVYPGIARRFQTSVKSPQFGWNIVSPDDSCQLIRPGYAYFANSFYLPDAPSGWSVSYSEYGQKFVAALERGSVLACQFHPELSGIAGLELLKHWLVRGDSQ